MSEATPSTGTAPSPHAPATAAAAPAAAKAPALAAASFVVRAATHEDLPAIAVAVCSLLLELGGAPPSQPALQQAARLVLEDPRAGALLVAEADGVLVGFLGASWQLAVRVPGRYGLIQELWTHTDWRERGVGAALIAALCELARAGGVERIEVGLPGERFAGRAATERFYEANGFAAIGTRMRRLL